MKNNIFAALFLATACIPVLASDDPKTLPTPIYNQLKSGKKLDKSYLTPDYDKAKGFKIGKVDYKAEYRSGDVMTYLPKALSTLAKDDAPFTLNIAVVHVSTQTYALVGIIMGAVTVEGQIVDSNGKVVAAFRTKEKSAPAGFGGKDDYNVAIDKIASAIAADLL